MFVYAWLKAVALFVSGITQCNNNTFVSPLGAGGKEGEKVAKKREYVKTYMSPWERAMKGNEELMATLKPHMPGPFIYKELPKYKSFNRWGLSIHLSL